MEKLNLTFLDGIQMPTMADPIEGMLHKFGQQIYDYAKGYFNYTVITTSSEDNVSNATLYIFVPEIEYDYKVLSLSYEDRETVTVRFYTLKTKQTAVATVKINDGLEQLYEKVNEFLTSTLANETYRFLVFQVNMKREHKYGENE